EPLARAVGVRKGHAVHATAVDPTAQRPPRGGWLLVILLPIGLIGLLRGAPAIDDRWENTPVHFWLVLATAVVCVVLAFAIVVCGLAAWAVVSVADLPPLRHPITPSQVGGPLGAVAGVGFILYAFAAFAYFRIYRRRGGALAFAVTLGFALLAEALVVVALS